MATALSFTTAKSMVISILQASQTAYASTVDGSNRQYSSDTEIANAILTADGEICNTIINTPLSPYQTTFVQISPALPGPSSNLPARNGIVLKVQCQYAPATTTFEYIKVNITFDTITIYSHGYFTGVKVWVSAGGVLPTGLSASTDYYVIYVDQNTIKLATSVQNAYNNIPVDITAQGTGTNTLTAQYINGTQAGTKDQIVQATQTPFVFSSNGYMNAPFWFIEGDVIYSSAPNTKVTYTDYTLTSSPQAPEPYLHAVVAGAVAELLKDGSDENMAMYYQNQYQGYLQMIMQGAKMIPEIASYK